MAYGKVRGIIKPLAPLPPRIYAVNPKNASESKAAILTIPIDFSRGDELGDELVRAMCADFNKEIGDGRTYPQEEELDLDGYKAYFMSYDLVLGLFLSVEQVHQLNPTSAPIPLNGLRLKAIQVSNISLASSKILALSHDSTSTSSTVSHTPVITLPSRSDGPPYAFAYYVKPNYPGRSSHLCNGGFIVPPSLRGLGLGRIAARSFLFYAPACGYRGSVFNLVYVDNEASVKLWEALGFQRVGRIPEAGRVRGKDGEEEWVDAWVVHGKFVGPEGIAVIDEQGDAMGN